MATDRPLDHFRATIITAYYTKGEYLSDSGVSLADTQPAVEDRQAALAVKIMYLPKEFQFHLYSTAHTSQVGLGMISLTLREVLRY